MISFVCTKLQLGHAISSRVPVCRRLASKYLCAYYQMSPSVQRNRSLGGNYVGFLPCAVLSKQWKPSTVTLWVLSPGGTRYVVVVYWLSVSSACQVSMDQVGKICKLPSLLSGRLLIHLELLLASQYVLVRHHMWTMPLVADFPAVPMSSSRSLWLHLWLEIGVVWRQIMVISF